MFNLKEGFYLLLLRVFIAGFTLASDIVITNWLGVYGKGQWQFYIEIIFIVSILLTAGQHYSINTKKHQASGRLEEYHSQAITNSLILFSFLVIGLLIYTYSNNIDLSIYTLTILTILIPIEISLTLLGVSLSTKNKLIQHFNLRIVRRSLVFFTALVLYLSLPNESTEDKIDLLISIYIISGVLAFLYGSHTGQLWPKIKKISINKEILISGIKILPGDIVERRQSSIEILVLGFAGLTIILGNYSIAIAISMIYSMIGQTVQQIILAKNTNINADSYVTFFRISLFINILILPIIGLLAQYILIPLFYSSDFQHAVLLTWFLLPMGLFGALITGIIPLFTQRNLQTLYSKTCLSFFTIRLFLAIAIVSFIDPVFIALSATVMTLLLWISLIIKISPKLESPIYNFIIPKKSDFLIYKSLINKDR